MKNTITFLILPNMDITFSIFDKPLNHKPKGSEASRFFKHAKVNRITVEKSEFIDLIKKGHTFTFIYKDSSFDNYQYSRRENYVGTQMICADIDSSEITPSEFVERIKYKPSFYYTSFSNLTEEKGNKYCFHLIYLLNTIVYGEENYKIVFNELTKDYKEELDSDAIDCHRVIYPSNENLPNFEIKEYDSIIDIKLFLLNDNNKKGSNVKKSKHSNKYNPTGAYCQKERKTLQMNLSLSEAFQKDLHEMKRGDFIDKWKRKYPYIEETIIPDEKIKITNEAIEYADIRDMSYYSFRRRIDIRRNKDNRSIIDKYKDGERTKNLLLDAAIFINIIPDITLEYLITMLLNDVYYFYDNSDKHLTNEKIVRIAISKLKGNNDINPLKKSFKLLEKYDKKAIPKKVGAVRRDLKDRDIESVIDLSKTIEDNLELLNSHGVKCSKKRLKQYLTDNGIEMLSYRDIRNREIQEIINANPEKSLRELKSICKDKDIKVSHVTLEKMKNEQVDNPKKPTKSEEIGELYDCSKSNEENIEIMKKYGLDISLSTLKRWKKANGLTKKAKISPQEPLNDESGITYQPIRENLSEGKEMGLKAIYQPEIEYRRKLQVS